MIKVCKNSSERHMADLMGGILCTSACGCIFACIIVWGFRWNWVIWGRIFGWFIVIYGKTRVISDHPVIRVRKNKRYEYGKTWVICDHLVIRVRTKTIYEERSVFLHLIDAGVYSTFSCIGYFQYFILIVLILVNIDLRGSMKLIKLKEFVVFWPWRRIEVESMER